MAAVIPPRSGADTPPSVVTAEGAERPASLQGAERAASLPGARRALVLIDFINPLRFPGSEKLAVPALAAAEIAARMKTRFAADGDTVCIYANDNYGVWQSDFHALVSLCMADPGESGEIARLLYPQAGDLTLLKPRHSAFFGTPLELMLRQMGVEELVLCGLATDLCVQMTAADAYLRGWAPRVPADASAAETPEAHAAALAWMARALKCDVSPMPKARAGRAGGSGTPSRAPRAARSPRATTARPRRRA